MAEVIFEHKRLGRPLIIDTGMNEASWGYNMNVAKFSTYGGEVVQILSVYIDNMKIGGFVRTYKKVERIYTFFMRYFSIATQGPSANASAENKFEQTPMVMRYPERGWTFHIQPLHAPAFEYSFETVAPKWELEAHIVDRGINAESLKTYVGAAAAAELKKFGELKLSGELSPISGDPANNPFIAPLTEFTKGETEKGEKIRFKPRTDVEKLDNSEKLGDYYVSLLPSYLRGDFADVVKIAGSQPIFGRPSTVPNEERAAEEKLTEEIIPSETQRK